SPLSRLFHDLQALVCRYVAHDLPVAAPGPEDFEHVHARRLAETNPLSQGVGAKATAAADDAINRARASAVMDFGTQPGADGGPVGACSNQTYLEPVGAVAGIGEQHIAELVAAKHASGIHEDVLIAIAVEIGNRDGTGLLQEPDPGAGGHVRK